MPFPTPVPHPVDPGTVDMPPGVNILSIASS